MEELEGRKETGMTKFKVLSQNFPGGTEENNKTRVTTASF
jgi:hypothetical protein